MSSTATQEKPAKGIAPSTPTSIAHSFHGGPFDGRVYRLGATELDRPEPTDGDLVSLEVPFGVGLDGGLAWREVRVTWSNDPPTPVPCSEMWSRRIIVRWTYNSADARRR